MSFCGSTRNTKMLHHRNMRIDGFRRFMARSVESISHYRYNVMHFPQTRWIHPLDSSIPSQHFIREIILTFFKLFNENRNESRCNESALPLALRINVYAWQKLWLNCDQFVYCGVRLIHILLVQLTKCKTCKAHTDNDTFKMYKCSM